MTRPPRLAPPLMPIAVRLVAGAGILVAGATHVWSYFHGYRSASVGPAFLVDAALSAAVGSIVLFRGSRASAWAGTVLSAAALASYATARTVGFLGFVERGWSRPSLLAAGCEALVIVLLVTEVLIPDPEVGSRSGG